MGGDRTDGWEGEFDFLDAAWAPDGDRFAYHTLNDVMSAQDGNGFRVHVARFVHDDAAEPTAEDDTMLEFDPMADDEGWQIWSPDGSRIAFQSYDQGNARLVIMPVPDTAGTESDGTAVTTTPFWSGAPGRLGYTWAPDGSAMVLVDFYVRPADATTFLVDAATGELQAMDWKTDGWPSWQYGTSR
jgi:Tol biopolymer transport system component